VKINANIGNSAVASSIEEEVEKMRWATQMGSGYGNGSFHRQKHSRNTRMDHSQFAGADRDRADLSGAGKVGGKAEDLKLGLYRATLIEQCEQGVDYFTGSRRSAAALRAADRKPHDWNRVARRLDHGEVVPGSSSGEFFFILALLIFAKS